MPSSRGRAREADLRVRLPADLARLVSTARASVGDLVPLRSLPGFAALVSDAGSSPEARARLTALIAGAVPFGATPDGQLWLYFLSPKDSPARRIVATLDPAGGPPHPICRGAAALAVLCALQVVVEAGDAPADVAEEAAARIPSPGVAEEEAVTTAFERARAVADLLVGSDSAVRKAARALAKKPMEDAPPPDTRRRLRERESPLALGVLLELFFREGDDEVRAVLAHHLGSDDAVAVEAARTLGRALPGAGGTKKSALAVDLERRRDLARRAARTAPAAATTRPAVDPIALTRAIVARLDAMPPALDPLTLSDEREENLLALAELGDREMVPSLVARAVTGDIGAVEMLGFFGDERAIPHLVEMLAREPQRHRHLESAVVRALGRLHAVGAAPVLRRVLAENPLSNWRDGIERAVLVRELASALGALRDEAAGPALVSILESRSQEYRAILPIAAWALGRIGHLPALRTLERMLASPKEQITREAVWAVGEIGRRHSNAKKRAGAILEACGGLEPGAEMTRLTALAKIRGGAENAPRPQDLRRALDRALWEPSFRQEETYRRRTWALRSLRDLSTVDVKRRRDDVFFLGHEAVRYFVTRDDPRVRRAAEKAFAIWNVPLPKARRYYAVVVDELEREGGIDALHEAIRDPLGVYRHNVATRLAERGDPRSARPLAEATARVFAEAPSSTYEYDDAPKNLVAFVRALSKLNRAEGNEVLIEGLRSGNHQVRAVVAENAPDDERFVPELRAMLGDPRSFLRSRAERSLAAMQALAPIAGQRSEPPPRRVEM